MLAEETGGIAVVNQNDFGKAIRRASTPRRATTTCWGITRRIRTPLKRLRQLEVKVRRADTNAWFRQRILR